VPRDRLADADLAAPRPADRWRVWPPGVRRITCPPKQNGPSRILACSRGRVSPKKLGNLDHWTHEGDFDLLGQTIPQRPGSFARVFQSWQKAAWQTRFARAD